MWLKSEIGGVQKNPKTDMETPTPPFKHNTTWCTKNKDGRTRNILGGGKKVLSKTNCRGEREKRQWVNHERGSAMADTDSWLGKWHHLFLFSTSLSQIGSEIEKRKTARAQSKNKTSLRLKRRKKFPEMSLITQTAMMLDLVSLNLCFRPIYCFPYLQSQLDRRLLTVL